MTEIPGWTPSRHSDDGRTFDIHRKGTGPGVIVIHEIPGLTQGVIGFGDRLVDAGFTVVMPHLFGQVGRPFSGVDALKVVPGLCVRREFTKLALGQSPPLAGWLRSLARALHAELGGVGVGAVGMCFTGGFALAMMVDPAVAAPVVAQPSLPFPIDARRRADLNLSPQDLDTVKRRAAAGCPVLGLKYADDPAVGTRFDTLRRELGDAFIAVELPGKQHSTLTEHSTPESLSRVVDFFTERLAPRPDSTRESTAPPA